MAAHRTASVDAAVYLVDQGLHFAERASRYLRPLGLAVRPCDTAAGFIDSYDPETPGCVVAGFGRGHDAMLLSEILCLHRCPPPVVGVGRAGDVTSAIAAFKGGAVDFLEAPLQSRALIESVHAALERDRSQRRRATRRAELEQRYERLTPRESEVFAGLAADMTAKRIAAQLGISPRTAEHHREGVMRKMQAHSWHELLVMAILLDVCQPDTERSDSHGAVAGRTKIGPHPPLADALPS